MTAIITMIEVINCNNKIHYPEFVSTVHHRCKVGPVGGNDNHGLTGLISLGLIPGLYSVEGQGFETSLWPISHST